MTGIYNTPEVLHIQECDVDGNKRIVRYYREDILEDFIMNTTARLREIRSRADGPPEGCARK